MTETSIEDWSDGVVEYWSTGTTSHHSNSQYSITPVFVSL
jgi:hypothetical protein